MKTTKLTTGILSGAVLVLALVLFSACGGGGGGDTLALNIPGDNTPGHGLSSLVPPVGSPAIETFAELGTGTETTDARWLKNCLFTLPASDGPNSIYQTAGTKQWADDIFAGINAQRLANGLSLLIREPHLDAIAQAHARDMALRNFFGHVNPYGLDPFQRMTAAGSPKYPHAAENASKGQRSAAEAVSDWVNSEKHKHNLMNPVYVYTGVGVYCDPTDIQMPMHMIQLFAEFSDNPATWELWVEPLE